MEPPSGSCRRLISSVAVFPTETIPGAMLAVVAILAVFADPAAYSVAPLTLCAVFAVGAVVAAF